MKSVYIGTLLLLVTFCQAQRKTFAAAAPDGMRRISFAGSSVTWGDGFLQSGLVKETIPNIQRGRAVTMEPRAVQITGDRTVSGQNSR